MKLEFSLRAGDVTRDLLDYRSYKKWSLDSLYKLLLKLQKSGFDINNQMGAFESERKNLSSSEVKNIAKLVIQSEYEEAFIDTSKKYISYTFHKKYDYTDYLEKRSTLSTNLIDSYSFSNAFGVIVFVYVIIECS